MLDIGDTKIKYKDIDQLCNLMDSSAVQQVLLEAMNLGVRNYTYELD